MKHLVTAVLLLACFITALAQPDKIKAKLILGIMGAQIDGDKLKGYDKPGVIAGMAMEMKLANKVSVQPEINYAQKGARSSSKSPFYAIVRLSYIDLSGVLNFYLKENIALQGGLYYGVMFRAMADGGGGFVDASKIYKGNDLGYIAGIDYRFTPKTSVNMRFGYSLVNVCEVVPQFNNTLSFSLRFMLGE